MRTLLFQDQPLDESWLNALVDNLQACGLGPITVVSSQPLPDATFLEHAHDAANPDGAKILTTDQGRYTLSGDPGSIIRTTVQEHMSKAPDLVISAIGFEPAMGEDLFSSNTARAALEATLMGIPAVALSMSGQGPWHLESAVQTLCEFIQQWRTRPVDSDTWFNITLPNRSPDQLHSWVITRQGRRRGLERSSIGHRQQNGTDQNKFWNRSRKPTPSPMPDDRSTVQQGHVSITPLRPVMSFEEVAGTLGQWPGFFNKPDERGLISLRSRERMVRLQLENRQITDPDVLAVMREVPRHLFVDEALAGRAYSDSPLPIGEGQTISQPYIVARMTESLNLHGDEEVLEIGTGSGYQTAVLSRLCKRVFTIERLEKLAYPSHQRMEQLGYDNIEYFVGDGTMGWPEERKFDRIIVTAGAPVAPETLQRQLKEGGIMVIPRGNRYSQKLLRLVNDGPKMQEQILETCRFVPLVG
ncbi:MAG: protein-L-isoaspartate(D-aspartate) O-methyltransferase, partial [Magnetococcales bacterium]|nr:protein-L-isoaspartate(D-aspartate) O-methyltransferase [Magnetococcales bacterium]